MIQSFFVVLNGSILWFFQTCHRSKLRLSALRLHFFIIVKLFCVVSVKTSVCVAFAHSGLTVVSNFRVTQPKNLLCVVWQRKQLFFVKVKLVVCFQRLTCKNSATSSQKGNSDFHPTATAPFSGHFYENIVNKNRIEAVLWQIGCRRQVWRFCSFYGDLWGGIWQLLLVVVVLLLSMSESVRILSGVSFGVSFMCFNENLKSSG